MNAWQRVGDLVSDLAAEIAAEEHAQGRIPEPVAGHCTDCDQQLTAAAAATVPVLLDPTIARVGPIAPRQTTCPHLHTSTDTVTFHTHNGRTLGSTRTVTCDDCGATWRGTRR